MTGLLDGLAVRWQALRRGDRVILALVGAVVLLRLIALPAVGGALRVGDEAYYFDAGRGLANLLRDLAGLHSPDRGELSRYVVGNGWFMPGQPVLLAPLFLVVPHASLLAIRAYLLVVSTVLLLVTAAVVRRTFGRREAAALLVFPGLVPMYAIFGMGGWGDANAGLVVMLMLCRLIVVLRRVRAGEPVGWGSWVGVGLLAIASVYLRSSVSLLVAAVMITALVIALLTCAPGARWRTFGGFVVAGVAFLAVLAPWSIGASRTFDDRVLTTTSVPTVMANTFGDRDRLCFGPCDPNSTIWFSPQRYAREVSRATGVSEVEVLGQMSVHARADVTPQSYARDVGVNTGRYLWNPGHFASLLDTSGWYSLRWPALLITPVMFYPAFLVLCWLLLRVVRGPLEHQVTALLIKASTVALLAQPFVHICGSRYWTTLAPLAPLAAVLLWRMRRDDPADGAVAPGEVADAVASRWLVRAQFAASAGVIAVVVAVGLLAIPW